MTLTELKRRVEAFHDKLGLGVMEELPVGNKFLLDTAVNILKDVSTHLYNGSTSNLDANYRAGLTVEEVAELLEAFSAGSDVQILDAVCDLIYVLVGHCVHVALPLEAGMVEVCRSNATKEPGYPRFKGPNFSPADLKKVYQDFNE